MAAYVQLGHDSWNLVDAPDIGAIAGVVLSPVNDGPADVMARIQALGNRANNLEIILDPQLYNPAANRGRLGEWAYYPDDFATADQSDLAWWVARGQEVVAQAAAIRADAICSPAYMARRYDDEYYEFIVHVADHTLSVANAHGLQTLLTAIVPLQDLADPARALRIASILTSSGCDRLYLTFLVEQQAPREPLRDGGALATAVHLVKLLSESMRVHVSFTAHDLVLWKCAGASDVSTGKFMNLRRFSPARWQDEEAGMRNMVDYWCDESLLTLLRDQDVVRLDRAGWFQNDNFPNNPASARIMEILREGRGAAWRAHSWRQYLRWACNADAHCATTESALNLLATASNTWVRMGRANIRPVDPYNDGSHIGVWINAAHEGAAR